MLHRRLVCLRGLLAALVSALSLAGFARAEEAAYRVTPLVSDVTGLAAHTDANLINAWGVAFNPNGFVWVADNETGRSTLYDGLGVASPLVVTIPAAPGSPGDGHPTGIVFSGSSDFAVSNGTVSAASRFLFATEDGVICGWAPSVDATHAIVAAHTPDAVYKGLALAADGTRNLLYAADFHGGKIDVFDRMFAPVTIAGGFRDPGVPAGFAPFNVQNLGGDLYVTYAKQDAEGTDEVAGPRLGFVDVFRANGELIRRVASGFGLNAPWGLAMAPAGFGAFANLLLVGNFGDGTISAYDPHTGRFAGTLRRAGGRPLRIPGLWGIAFGNGLLNQSADTLFFAAGPGDEEHGLYGKIELDPGH